MSAVYATEPSTSGKVVFETTHGPLEIQLWCRECPTATRFFLQLCLDGFYNGMLFHRILPNFLIQTGALRQPPVDVNAKELRYYRSSVKADYALERRKYELHSRLRFNHRGQVAMALGVDDDDEQLQPQFFITLDESSFLDGKNVLFGTISGPTIFNALRIGKLDADDKTGEPTDLENAPRIQSVRIVDHPFEDLVAQSIVPWRKKDDDGDDARKKKKKKRKGKLDVNVLSFGDEMEDVVTGGSGGGIKSSHDVLSSKTLSKEVAIDVQAKKERTKEKDGRKQSSDDGKKAKPTKDEKKEDGQAKALPQKAEASLSSSSSVNNKARVESRAKVEEQSASRHEKKASSAVEARRAKYVKGRKNKREREEDTLNKLLAFKSKVKGQVGGQKSTDDEKDSSLASRMARRAQGQDKSSADNKGANDDGYHGQVLEDDDGDDGQEWLQTKFKCRRHMDHKARAGDGRDADDYEVVDERAAEGDEPDDAERRHEKKRHKKHHKHHREDRHRR